MSGRTTEKELLCEDYMRVEDAQMDNVGRVFSQASPRLPLKLCIIMSDHRFRMIYCNTGFNFDLISAAEPCQDI
jgi:hypothetical protein